MKKLSYLLGIIVLISITIIACEKKENTFNTQQSELSLKANDGCVTIQSGEIYSSQGELITLGFMENGYNYQAHMYSGDYYGDGSNLIMKWNDAWLSNKDCGTQVGQGAYTDPFLPDGKLDRHYGYDSYIGSGAWLTNHWNGSYMLEDGTVCHWTEFTKIVAVPEGAYLDEPIYTDPWGDSHLTFYTEDGDVIGYEIWDQFAVIEDIINDPCGGYNGVEYKSPDHAGFGGW